MCLHLEIFLVCFCAPFVPFVVNCFLSPQKKISIDIISGDKMGICVWSIQHQILSLILEYLPD